VERLAQAYTASGTDTKAVLGVLFRSVEFWIATGLAYAAYRNIWRNVKH